MRSLRKGFRSWGAVRHRVRKRTCKARWRSESKRWEMTWKNRVDINREKGMMGLVQD